MLSIQQQLSVAVDHYNADRIREAVQLVDEILQRDPKNVMALRICGIAARKDADLNRALELLNRAQSLAPGHAMLHFERAVTLTLMDRDAEAFDCYLKAAQLRPDFQPASLNLSALLQKHERWEEALPWAQKAAELKPDCAMAQYNMSNSLREMGQIDEAIRCGLRSVRLNPGYHKAHWNMGMCYLLQGDYARGWPLFELREKCEEVALDKYVEPRWDGTPLTGKTIVVHAEQGIGDEVLFASCFPDIIAEAGKVILVCEPRLATLFGRSFPQAQVYGFARLKDWSPPVLPEAFDLQVPAGSLPLHYRRSVEKFPQRKSFLTVAPNLLSTWQEKLSALGPGLKVGISWRAGGKPMERRKRTVTLDQWGEVFRVPGVHFVNLQYSDSGNDLADARERFGVEIHDWEQGDPLVDMDSYAAKIAALDLVISVGNATVHLAGAVGTPAWTLLPMVPSWRWMVAGERSPWYTSVHLFRQRERGQWAPVMSHITELLRERVKHGCDTPVAPVQPMRKASRRHDAANSPTRSTSRGSWLSDEEASIKITNEALAELCERAAARLEANNMAQAESLYRQVLQIAPRHTKALTGLACIARATGRADLAIRSLRRSLALIENNPANHCLLAAALADDERYGEALKHYRRALELCPEMKDALLGIAQLSLHVDASERAKAATEMTPAESLVHRGYELSAAYQLDEAVECFEQALDLQSDYAPALAGLAEVYLEDQRYDDAIRSLREALTIQPDAFAWHCQLAHTLYSADRLDEATESYRRALELNPGHLPTLIQLADLERQAANYAVAAGHLNEALAWAPQEPQVHNLMGMVRQEQGRSRDAVSHYDQALRFSPDFAAAHANRAFALLQEGQFAQGWREYEWRWRCTEASRPRNFFSQPTWDGSSLTGRSILIHGEQAIGDEIMFASCYAEIIRAAQRTVIACEPRLETLFRRSFPDASVYAVSRGREHLWRLPASEHVDVQIAAGSLPQHLRTTEASFPREDKFLQADPLRQAIWLERFATLGPGLRVGISWRAGDKPEDQRLRSTTLDDWRPLLDIPGVHWINLQYGEAQPAGRFAALSGRPIHSWSDQHDPNDLEELAAKIAALDLVICVGNTTTHLAGSLGVHCWVLLPAYAGWRWLAGRSDSVWYRKLRLFRQESQGNWENLFMRVRAELFNRATSGDETSQMRGIRGPHWNAAEATVRRRTT